MTQSVLAFIEQQISDAKPELAIYRPSEMNWCERARSSAAKLIPLLENIAPGMKDYVEGVLNAPVNLRTLWKQARTQSKLPEQVRREFDRQLELDDVLRESMTGETISKVVTIYLTNQSPDFQSNGRSDYPDLYLRSADYSGLSMFRRQRGEDEEFGAALKGSDRRPVRVPDGLEIKTCRDQIRVDCHHPHAGLHLVVLFSEESRHFTVTDICVAFLKSSDYREAARNTTATTVKYSFNRDHFISLLHTTAP